MVLGSNAERQGASRCESRLGVSETEGLRDLTRRGGSTPAAPARAPRAAPTRKPKRVEKRIKKGGCILEYVRTLTHVLTCTNTHTHTYTSHTYRQPWSMHTHIQANTCRYARQLKLSCHLLNKLHIYTHEHTTHIQHKHTQQFTSVCAPTCTHAHGHSYKHAHMHTAKQNVMKCHVPIRAS